MKKMPYVIIGIIAIGLIAYFLLKPKTKTMEGDYFISTQTQSDDRIKKLNLNSSSENNSNILDESKLSFPNIIREKKTEYKSDPEKEWLINIIQTNGENFKKEELGKIFDLDWRKNFTSTVYGVSTADNLWTYVFAGGTPEIYSKIQIGIDVQEVYNQEPISFEPTKLERYISELNKRIEKYPTKLRIENVETVSSAITKAKKLLELYHEFDLEATVILKSDTKFKGSLAWDALQSVGLHWGDGDLFHWANNNEYGHDQHFSVWTSTEPGYFLPERIKDGSMNPNDLCFSFSVPRSADPKNIFSIMIESVKYCQTRLGGKLLDKNGQPFNETLEKQNLDNIIVEMKNKGLVAGSDKALRMF
jgi:ZipA, C-terminal FtsZ-binding domain